MPIEDIAAITITSVSSGITREGFGKPLIVGYSQRFADRLRVYRSSAAMLADGFLVTDPEYLAAVKLSSQNPRVKEWAIGRGNLKPTMAGRLTHTLLNSQAYKGTVNGLAFSFTSDPTATDTEVRAGLKTAIDALAVPGLTVTDPASGVFITWTATIGTSINFTVDDPAVLAQLSNHADPGISTDLAAIKLFNNDWYVLLLTQTSKAMILAAAAWVEANKKLYVAQSSDTEIATTGIAGGDVYDTLRVTNYGRTAPIYHQDPGSYAAAGWAGDRLPFDAGSETWAFAQINGVAATNITATHQANLEAKRVTWIESIAGRSVTRHGKVSANEFIDTVRGRDALEAKIRENVFALITDAQKKIPFTNPGAQVIASGVFAALREFVNVGFLSDNPAPTVTVPDVADVDPADRAARILPDVTFTGTYAGAIHSTEIAGSLSV